MKTFSSALLHYCLLNRGGAIKSNESIIINRSFKYTMIETKPVRVVESIGNQCHNSCSCGGAEKLVSS
jgi:hypothetical protein